MHTNKPDPSKPCTATPLSEISGNSSAMDKLEAETIFDLGKETTVAKLLEQDQQIKKLEKQLASLKKDSSNSLIQTTVVKIASYNISNLFISSYFILLLSTLVTKVATSNLKYLSND